METLATTHFSRMAITGIVATMCVPTVVGAAPEDAWLPTWPSHAYYRPANLGTEIRAMRTPCASPDPLDSYTPRTALGYKLLSLRRAHLASGGRLLNWDEIGDEVRLRRGGLTDA